MCTTCGCGGTEHRIKVILPESATKTFFKNSAPTEALTLEADPAPVPEVLSKKVIALEADILQKNNSLAERNRGYFEAKGIFALNFVSSPGSGKTSLLEKTLLHYPGKIRFFVIEGDQQTSHDADRIAATGAAVVQINTGKGCHLDASMIHESILQLQPSEESIVFIENVGNLVCPAMFDLGEFRRVVIISVTEGDDKPIKYPDMFHSADLCIINKTDLLPYVPFDIQKAKEYALQVNPHLEFIELSAYKEEGLSGWFEWIEKTQLRYLQSLQLVQINHQVQSL